MSDLELTPLCPNCRGHQYRLEGNDRAYADGNRDGFKRGHKQGTMFAIMRLLDLGFDEAASALARSFKKSERPEEGAE